MTDKLRGIIIPTATPFDEEGSVSLAMLEDNLAKWGRTGVHGYMVLGSNGEFRSLSDEESLSVATTALEHKGDRTLIVGVGRESLRLTLGFLDRVAGLGAGVDYVSVLTPGYFAKLMDDRALVDHYTAVADHSPVPVLLYVAPGFANSVSVSPAALRALAEHPNIAGLKDTTSSSMVDYFLAAGGRDDFCVLAGSLGTLMTCLTLGGTGGVVSAANYFPVQCAEITELHFAGEGHKAVERYLSLLRIVKTTGAKRGVAGLKCCMDLCGFSGGAPRLPVQPLSVAERDDMKAVLVRHGLVEP